MKPHTIFSALGIFCARLPALAMPLLISTLLYACGGGEGTQTSSVGSGGSGLANGTVSGFGSVYVDGVEIEDAQSSNVVENADGTTATVSLKLGQRVRVRQDSLGAASQVMVEALVSGSVSAVNTATGQITVAGQTVAVNGNTATGPLTVFGGGYLALADVRAGDTAEVHGSVQPAAQTAQAGGYTILATRIEKLSATPAVRVMGTVARLNTADASFAINGLTVRYSGATLVPATATLAEGQAVTVWGTAAAQGTGTTSATLQASRIRVGNAALGDVAVGGAVQASGLVSALDSAPGSASRSFTVQGLQVNAAGASLTPAGVALANAAYVRVNGVLAADGSITARSVQVQQAGGDTARVRLTGAIGSFLNTTSFVVRDVPVDASGITIATACPGQVLASGVFVDVTAQLQAGTDVVKALALTCPKADALPPFAMREYRGTATGVVTASRSFTLAQAAGTTPALLTVQWTQQTVFKGLTAATLSGTSLVAEGYLDGNGVLIAREIRTPGQREADRFDPRQGSGDSEWARYDQGFRPAPPPTQPTTQPGTQPPAPPQH